MFIGVLNTIYEVHRLKKYRTFLISCKRACDWNLFLGWNKLEQTKILHTSIPVYYARHCNNKAFSDSPQFPDATNTDNEAMNLSQHQTKYGILSSVHNWDSAISCHQSKVTEKNMFLSNTILKQELQNLQRHFCTSTTTVHYPRGSSHIVLLQY